MVRLRLSLFSGVISTLFEVKSSTVPRSKELISPMRELTVELIQKIIKRQFEVPESLGSDAFGGIA